MKAPSEGISFLKSELCNNAAGNSNNVGHLSPDRRDAIPFQGTISNHVRASSPITSLAVGAYATCVIVENSLQCWGRSDFVGGNPDGSTPLQWVKAVQDLTPPNQNLRLKKVVVSKTDAGIKFNYNPIIRSGLSNGAIPSEKDTEIFCLLADDYTSVTASNQPGQSAVYCWGNSSNSTLISTGTAYSSPQLIPMSTTATTSVSQPPIKTGVYSDLYVTQSFGCLIPASSATNGPVCWGTGAPTLIPATSASFSTSGLLSCYLDPTSQLPQCYGAAGYASGHWWWNGSAAYAQPLWDPTSLLRAYSNGNAFTYDVPENPQTITIAAPLIAGATMTGAGQATVTYTQVTTQTQTQVGAQTGALSGQSNPLYTTPRTIYPQTGALTITPPQFKKVVTMKANACALDVNGSVWCWGFCDDTVSSSFPSTYRMATGGPSPYCRVTNSDYNTGIDVNSDPSSSRYNPIGRYVPTKVAWMAFLSDPGYDLGGGYGAYMTVPYRKILAAQPSLSSGPSTSTSKLASTTPYLDHVIDLYPGVYSICALRDVDWPSTGTNPYEVFCWGYNALGNLGDGTGDSSGVIRGTSAARNGGSMSMTTMTNISTSPIVGAATVTSVVNGTTTNVYVDKAQTVSSSTTSGISTSTTTTTNLSVVTGVLPAPTLTVTPGSYIGAPTFSLPKK